MGGGLRDFAASLVWLVVVVSSHRQSDHRLSQWMSVDDEGFLTRCSRPARWLFTEGNHVQILDQKGPKSTRRRTRRDPRRGQVGHPLGGLTSSSRGRCAISSSLRSRTVRGTASMRPTTRSTPSAAWPSGAGPERLRRPGAGSELDEQPAVELLARLNNRTHRELLIVDGSIAFAGGAGIADWWAKPGKHAGRGATRWPASRGRSWRRCRASRPRTGWNAAGEILTGPDALCPPLQHAGNGHGGRSSRARPRTAATRRRGSRSSS